jgi:hypothetical protein
MGLIIPKLPDCFADIARKELRLDFDKQEQRLAVDKGTDQRIGLAARSDFDLISLDLRVRLRQRQKRIEKRIEQFSPGIFKFGHILCPAKITIKVNIRKNADICCAENLH